MTTEHTAILPPPGFKSLAKVTECEVIDSATPVDSCSSVADLQQIAEKAILDMNVGLIKAIEDCLLRAAKTGSFCVELPVAFCGFHNASNLSTWTHLLWRAFAKDRPYKVHYAQYEAGSENQSQLGVANCMPSLAAVPFKWCGQDCTGVSNCALYTFVIRWQPNK